MSVIFDQLRISDDGHKLYINAHVNTADYFTNVFIKNITIITADKVSETAPYIPTSDYIYRKDMGESSTLKELNLVIDKGVLDAAYANTDAEGDPIHEGPTARIPFESSDFSSHLFFVYIGVVGEPGECTPCALDKEYSLGITFDENLLYQRVMQFTKSLADDCQIPVGFTDFILLWNAFKASIETEHYIPAVKYYNMLFDKSSSAASFRTSKPCGCHG